MTPPTSDQVDKVLQCVMAIVIVACVVMGAWSVIEWLRCC
jgi:hypothetical protein